MSRASVVVADDHSVVRAGVRGLLEGAPDFRVCAEAADGRAAVEAAVAHEPDIVILDWSMPLLSGRDAALELRRVLPGTRLLFLSMHDDPQYMREARRAGADGYVVKSVADRELLDACRRVLAGGEFVCAGTTVPSGGGLPDDPLTARELEVVALIADARTNQQIADALCISPKTVERHRANILEKLRMRDRVELTRYAIRRGLITA